MREMSIYDSSRSGGLGFNGEAGTTAEAKKTSRGAGFGFKGGDNTCRGEKIGRLGRIIQGVLFFHYICPYLRRQQP